MIVYLVRDTDGRYEIDSPPADPPAASGSGFWSRQFAAVRARWAEAVRHAHSTTGDGFWARWRSRVIRHLDESLDEQRTLRWLRDDTAATLVHPAGLTSSEASAILNGILVHASGHHGRWLAVDVVLFAASGVLFFVPGPNLVAYYFAFRLIGHYLAWRGARHALERIAWTFEPGS
jgi:hypothetical protein